MKTNGGGFKRDACAEFVGVGLRPPHKRHGGLWEFPGGKCEINESDADTARRELAEELEVCAVAIGSEIFVSHDADSEFLIAFQPVEITGEPHCVEHTAITWATAGELLAMPLAPSDGRFVEFLVASKK